MNSASKRTLVGHNLETGERIVVGVFGDEQNKYISGMRLPSIHSVQVAVKAIQAGGIVSTFEDATTQYTLHRGGISHLPDNTASIHRRNELHGKIETYFTRISDVNFATMKYVNVRGQLISVEACSFGDYAGTRYLIGDESGAALVIGTFGTHTAAVGTLVYCLKAEPFINRSDGHTELSAKAGTFLATNVSKMTAPAALNNYTKVANMAEIGRLYNRSATATPVRTTMTTMLMTMAQRKREAETAALESAAATATTAAASSSSSSSDSDYVGIDAARVGELFMSGIVELQLKTTGVGEIVYNACVHVSAQDGTTKDRMCAKKVTLTGAVDLQKRPILDHEQRPIGASVHPRTECMQRWKMNGAFIESPLTATPITVNDDVTYPTVFETYCTDDFTTQYFGHTAADWTDMPICDREAIMNESRETPRTIVVTVTEHGRITSMRLPTNDEFEVYHSEPTRTISSDDDEMEDVEMEDVDATINEKGEQPPTKKQRQDNNRTQ